MPGFFVGVRGLPSGAPEAAEEPAFALVIIVIVIDRPGLGTDIERLHSLSQ